MQDLKKYLNKMVDVVMDRPLGSRHPKFNFVYEVNYGYIPGTKAPDGGGIDVYVLGIDKPLKIFRGICIAVVHRLNDNDDKLIVVLKEKKFSENEIEKAIKFQEKFFKHILYQ